MPIPDETLHSTATGRDGDIVKAHENARVDQFSYSGVFCPFVQRVPITLEEKKIPDRYQEIKPRGLAPTPGAPTPDDEQPLVELTVNCEYPDDPFQDVGPVIPTDPFERAKLKVSIDYATRRIIPALQRLLQHTSDNKPYGMEEEEARREVLKTLVTWIGNADPEGPFYAGRTLTLSDVVLAPWAVRLWVFDRVREGGLGVPGPGEGGADEGLWERWRRWVGAVDGRESVVDRLSEREYYLTIKERYIRMRLKMNWLRLGELKKVCRERKGYRYRV